jgi:hypothetical protein
LLLLLLRRRRRPWLLRPSLGWAGPVRLQHHQKRLDLRGWQGQVGVQVTFVAGRARASCRRSCAAALPTPSVR